MKNPLRKRIGRELREEAGKYIALFLFLSMTIAIVSGFLVADDSMRYAYEESFQKYNVEDGHFEMKEKADTSLLRAVERRGVRVYPLYYKEESMRNGRTLRVFKTRTKINGQDLLRGRMPVTSREIALDRLFAVNNNIDVGDTVKVSGHYFCVSGYVALSDYSAMFQNNGDTMFDATHFGVAVTAAKGFQRLGTSQLHYQYAWKNKDSSLTEKQQNKLTDRIGRTLVKHGDVENLVQRGDNQAINFTGDDMGGDRSMFITFLYIIIVVMGFIFGVTTRTTLEREAGAIGTLRASGYTRGEMLRHYLALPTIVTLAAALAGNLLGHTVIKGYMADLYYNSYSLTSYHTLWSGTAFLLTTVIPCILITIIDALVLHWTFRIGPLQFLRRDLHRNVHCDLHYDGRRDMGRVGPHGSHRDPHCDGYRDSRNDRSLRLPFLSRFRLRIILQNRTAYLITAVGIFFASVLLLFGLMLQPLISHYSSLVDKSQIARYQYVLKAPVPVRTHNAEKYALKSLKVNEKDEISVYGIRYDSIYLDLELPDRDSEVIASSGYMEKYGLKVGDRITLREKYSGKKYSFRIAGKYDYDIGFALFMSRPAFEATFQEYGGYFNGYFSDLKIRDLKDKYVSTVITESDLKKVSNQLEDSMGRIFDVLTGFSVLLYMLIIYLLAQLIVNKNSDAISMIKILGYSDEEVAKLYNRATGIVVVLALVFSTFLSTLLLRALWKSFLLSMTGWIPFYIPHRIYPEMVAIGLAAYFLIQKLLMRRIRKIPMAWALKNMD